MANTNETIMAAMRRLKNQIDADMMATVAWGGSGANTASVNSCSTNSLGIAGASNNCRASDLGQATIGPFYTASNNSSAWATAASAGEAGDFYTDSQLDDMEDEAVAEERTRILAHLDACEPGREPYTRASAEFERKIARRLWERIRAAVEGGEEVPQSEQTDSFHLAVSTSDGPTGGLKADAAKQTPSPTLHGYLTVAGIGDKKWGA